MSKQDFKLGDEIFVFRDYLKGFMDNFNNNIPQPPKPAGYLKICGNYHVGVIKKPNWFHRKMIKLIFGFEWFDDK